MFLLVYGRILMWIMHILVIFASWAGLNSTVCTLEDVEHGERFLVFEAPNYLILILIFLTQDVRWVCLSIFGCHWLADWNRFGSWVISIPFLADCLVYVRQGMLQFKAQIVSLMIFCYLLSGLIDLECLVYSCKLVLLIWLLGVTQKGSCPVTSRL